MIPAADGGHPALMLAIALALPACSTPESFAELSPSSLDFGEVPLGTSASEALTICAVGDRDLSFELSLAPPFSFDEGAQDLGFIVAEGACSEVAVTFLPDAEGLREGALSLSFSDERRRVTGGLDVPLSGIGITPDDGTGGETGGDTGGGDGGGGGRDTGDGTGGADTGGPDTGGPDTGGPDTGSADTGATAGPCPDYSGINLLGYTRTYVTTTGHEERTGGSGSYRTWTESIGDDGRALVWVESTYTDRLGGVLSALTASTYLCSDDGIYLEGYTSESSYTSDSSSFEETEEVRYTDTLLLMVPGFTTPERFEDSWAREISAWSSLAGKSSSSAFGDVSAEALSEGTSAVPAGSFSTLEVAITTQGSDGTRQTETQHLDRALGLIASEDYELLSYE